MHAGFGDPASDGRTRRRVAFYSPIKPPDHPVPSGDREMARLLLRALELAGFEPELASRLRMLDIAGDADHAEALVGEAGDEVERLCALYRARPPAERPALFFTYHSYYKTPDLIGPAVAQALGIPYAIAEASRAPKRAEGRWARGHAQADAALAAADLLLVVNPRDRACLEAFCRPAQAILDLPPFLDADAWPEAGVDSLSSPASRKAAREGDPEAPAGQGASGILSLARSIFGLGGAPARAGSEPRSTLKLLTVAMMRPGDKFASYTLLAQALKKLGDLDWSLEIVGEGIARAEVETLFKSFGKRVRLLGRIDDRARLGELYRQADLLVWPAVNEAFGMVFLEAALHFCPSVAGDFGGVRTVVHDGESGLVTPPGDADAFAAALRRLAGDCGLLATLSQKAGSVAREQHGLVAASARLGAALDGLLVQPASPA